MSVIRCPQGHYYDDQRFSRCPHCGITSGAGGQASPSGSSGREAQEGKTRSLFGWLDKEKTLAFGHKKAAEAGSQEETDGDHTIALGAEPVREDDQRTVSFYSGARGNDYVTGWLVCVEGPEKGRDYRLHHGFNRIGRDMEMDVQVMDDLAVSRKNHCSVVYDEKGRTFSVVPSPGSLTYYGDQLLEKARPLEAGDEIRMGESSFVFIPFCGKDRVWER